MNIPDILRPPAAGAATMLRVFVKGPRGGNPTALVADARHLGAEQMRQVAVEYGHESAFVLPAADTRHDWRFRFFVPGHEMEMCGHAMVGTLWALRQWGLWNSPSAAVETASGVVRAWWDEDAHRVWISQPMVTVQSLASEDCARVAQVLSIAAPVNPAMINASTSRVKTLVPLAGVDALNRMKPDFSAIESVCEGIGSTGLYPFALQTSSMNGNVIHARQFPKASGYPEDAATGIAAAALWGYLVNTGAIAAGTAQRPVLSTIVQGEAMGSPSAIQVMPRHDKDGALQGCWLSGKVAWQDA